MAVDGIDPDKEGTDWSADEIAVLVGSYFLMLADERAGRLYNKSEYRRGVMKVIGRKPGSIERKLQNVSAVLDEIGIPWIQGYKPLPHYQDALVDIVERQLSQHSRLFDGDAVGPPRIPDEAAILIEPPPFISGDPNDRPASIRRLIGKFDPAARDKRNRNLGRAGEEFVVGFETRRLVRAGRNDLAHRVRWVADLDGDGAGYDVRSFEPNGSERLLEVKTTCGNERTPFWMTRRECDVASENLDAYRLRRVFHFRNGLKMFDIAPPLEFRLLLTPTAFMAALK